MRKLLLLLTIALPLTVSSQYWEIGPMVGASVYNGDFTETLIDYREIHMAYGGLVRYNISRIVTLKANIYRGMLSGTDANAKRYYERRWNRNLHFRSKVLDIAIMPEINLTGFQVNSFSYKSSPYIFAGVALFRFNPQAEYNGEWVNLQPLGTEGQYLNRFKDRRYSLTQISIPMGFGWKYSYGKNITIGVEFSARKTFTDYIDDVSTTYVDRRELAIRNGDIAVKLMNRTGEVNPEEIEYEEGEQRGSPDAKDWYYFAGFTISYSFLPLGCMKY